MKKRLKINGLIMFLACVSVAVFPQVFFRNKEISPFDEFAEIIGIALMLLGQIFRISARGYKSEHSQEGIKLIQGGPYALVRNPMYLGIILIGIGMVLVLFNWWVALVFLLIFIVRYYFLIFKEEKKLISLFPNEYRVYMKRVPRLLPSLYVILNKDMREYLPVKSSWLKKEIGTILTILLMTIFIESWEDIKNEGLSAYFREAVLIISTIALFILLVIYLARRRDNVK